MMQGDRVADPQFDDLELLFRRCLPEYYNAAVRQIDAEGFRFPDISVNRQRYSRPEDCRYDTFHHCYVLEFQVAVVPRSLPGENGGHTIYFQPVHAPEQDNYGHSELRAYKDEGRTQHLKKSSKIPEAIKRKFRQIVAERAEVRCQPAPHLNQPDEPLL